MYCKNCGKEIADDSKFCQHCGCLLNDTSRVPNRYPRLSKWDWTAILLGMAWIVFWTKETCSNYVSELEILTNYAQVATKAGICDVIPTNLQKMAYAKSVEYFSANALLPLIFVAIAYLLAPILFKKYKEHKEKKAKK